MKARDSWFNDHCAVFDTPHGWNPGIPGSATAAPYPKIRRLIAVSPSVNFRIPYGISILYNILEMNVMFFSQTLRKRFVSLPLKGGVLQCIR